MSFRRFSRWFRHHGPAITLVIAAGFGTAIWFALQRENGPKKKTTTVQQHSKARRQVVDQALAATLCSLLAEPRPASTPRGPDLAEILRNPTALDWGQNESSASEVSRLTLAASAMDFEGPPCLLAQALVTQNQSVGALTTSPARLVIAARMAVLAGDFAKATPLLQECAKAEPTNAWHRANLAALRLLQEKDLAPLAEARRSLREMFGQGDPGAWAARILAWDAVKENDLARARICVGAIGSPVGGEIQDELLQLALAKSTNAVPPADRLADLGRKLTAKPWAVPMVAGWLASQGQPLEAGRWVRSFKEANHSNPPLELALWQCAVAMGDWRLAEEELQTKGWGTADFLRWALLARTARERQQQSRQEFFWNGARRLAGHSYGAQTALYGLTRAWGWPAEMEEVLQQISSQTQWQAWALKELEATYLRQQNTTALLGVYDELLKLEPQNLAFQKGFITTALLTRRNLAPAHRLAEELKTRNPQDPETIALYAYSLHLQLRTTAGLEALGALKAEDLNRPRIAAYYGVLLANNGEQAKARQFLAKASEGKLWPEEKKLVAEAEKMDGKKKN